MRWGWRPHYSEDVPPQAVRSGGPNAAPKASAPLSTSRREVVACKHVGSVVGESFNEIVVVCMHACTR